MFQSIPTIGEALDHARQVIGEVDARVLLQRALAVDPAHLIAHPEDLLTQAAVQRYAHWVGRRGSGEPVAYIVGAQEFYSLAFQVTQAVLIPRPETELLVDLALERMHRDKPVRVLDLGTGSGAVAIAIAKNRPGAAVTATELWMAALAIAKDNAARLGAGNVRFMHGDWYEGLEHETFDIIVSNPPYVAAEDPHLEQGDLRFEPHEALVGGADGLDCIRRIVADAPNHLHSGGWLLFEHGYDQAAACRELLSTRGFSGLFSGRDLAGIERVSGGQWLTGRRATGNIIVE